MCLAPKEESRAGGGLRIAYVYRNFNDQGSIHALYRRNAERLARDEDVTAFCSARTRDPTSAPLQFQTVEPLVFSRGRIRYAIECATFARRATRALAIRRDHFDVIHVEGFAATEADLVSVHAVRPAEIEHYFGRIEPDAWLRRRLSPRFFRPQLRVVMNIEQKLFRGPTPLVMVPTDRIAADLERWYGVPRELVEVVPYGIETRLFRPDPDARVARRQEEQVDENRLALLFVGDDFERKGLDRVLLAMAASRSTAVLWVVGGGNISAADRLARELGIADKITFFGRQAGSELLALYAACDVALLPSRQDSWGHTIIEGLAAGRVVVASEFAGAHEIIEDGVTGYVLRERGSVAAQIAALIGGPLADAERRAKLGAAAAQLARLYDHEALYPRFRAAHYKAYELRVSRMAVSDRGSVHHVPSLDAVGAPAPD